MICRKCGCRLERDRETCYFCGEEAKPSGREREPIAHVVLPPKVPLGELSPVPGSREETLRELRRLQAYFRKMEDKYAVLSDLWMLDAHLRAPSLLHWTVAGGLLALVVQFFVALHLPLAYSSLFFIIWGAVATLGYMWSGRRYEHTRARLALDIRRTENAIREHFNKAEGCFLPLDYTQPEVIRELIEGLDSGLFSSFEDFRMDKTVLSDIVPAREQADIARDVTRSIEQ